MIPNSVSRVVGCVGCVQDDWVLSPADSLPRATEMEISIVVKGPMRSQGCRGRRRDVVGTRLADIRPAQDPRHSWCLAKSTAEIRRELARKT